MCIAIHSRLYKHRRCAADLEKSLKGLGCCPTRKNLFFASRPLDALLATMVEPFEAFDRPLPTVAVLTFILISIIIIPVFRKGAGTMMSIPRIGRCRFMLRHLSSCVVTESSLSTSTGEMTESLPNGGWTSISGRR